MTHNPLYDRGVADRRAGLPPDPPAAEKELVRVATALLDFRPTVYYARMDTGRCELHAVAWTPEGARHALREGVLRHFGGDPPEFALDEGEWDCGPLSLDTAYRDGYEPIRDGRGRS